MAEKVGAFWKKELPDGRVVYNGHVTVNGEKVKLNLWANDKGDNPKRPDLNAVLDTYVPKDKGEAIGQNDYEKGRDEAKDTFGPGVPDDTDIPF